MIIMDLTEKTLRLMLLISSSKLSSLHARHNSNKEFISSRDVQLSELSQSLEQYATILQSFVEQIEQQQETNCDVNLLLNTESVLDNRQIRELKFKEAIGLYGRLMRNNNQSI